MTRVFKVLKPRPFVERRLTGFFIYNNPSLSNLSRRFKTLYPLRLTTALGLSLLRLYGVVPKYLVYCDYHTERPHLKMILKLELLEIIPYLRMHQGPHGHTLAVALRLA